MKNSIKLFAIVCVLLCVSNAMAQTTTMVTFWGAATPTATLVSNDANDTNCVGTAVQFTATTQPGAQYQFLVNGVTAQPASAANTFTPSPLFTVGNQQVIVIVDNGTCSSRDTVNFVTLALPTPTLIVAPGNTICAGTSATFTAGGGINYNFKINGTTVQNGPTATYTTSSLTNGQVVTVDVTNAGSCIATAGPITMTVNALPTPTLASDAPGNASCATAPVVFTATGGVNYNFKVNGTTVQNGPTATYTTSTLTNGQIVSVEVTNATSCLATATPITMTIRPLPTVASALGNPTPECVNSMATVTLTGLTGTGPWTFEFWNVDGSNNATTLYYTVPGNLSTANGTISVPIPATGFVAKRMKIRDQYCPSFY